MIRALAVLGLVALGCGDNLIERGDPPPYGEDDILWAPIDLDGAPDLGHTAVELPPIQRSEAGPIALREIAVEAGLGESRSGGNAHGVGVGFVDIDNDGFEDIILITGSRYPKQVYRNNGDGTFSDASAASGVAAALDGLDGYSIAAADYDADGDLDLYVGAMPADVLLQNDGAGVFTDVTGAAGAGGPPTEQVGTASKIVAWGDHDGDGLMDIAVASSTFTTVSTHGYLLRNRGDGTFEDVTAATGYHASEHGNPCAMMWSDIDADGDQDLWIWNDRAGNEEYNRILLRNDGGVFTDITEDARVTRYSGNPMGIDSADLDHDGRLDVYVSDIGSNELYWRDDDGTYVELGGSAQAHGDYGWGLALEDLDGDSWADIFVAQEDDRPYLTFRNQRVSPPAFVRADWPHGPIGNGHNVAAAVADFDHDGDVDIVTAGTSGTRMNLLRNDTDRGSHGWLEVRVNDVPRTGARGGISGRVVVKTGDLLQFRDITGGSSRASQNAMSVRFGLGHWSGAEYVAVLFPDGRQRAVRNVAGEQILDL